MRVYHNFFWYPDPDQRFLMRIRIQANDTDPETLAECMKLKCIKYFFPFSYFM